MPLVWLEIRTNYLSSMFLVRYDPSLTNTNRKYSLLVPPTIDEGPTDITASLNTRTILVCQTLGLPEPSITWFKDGEEMQKSSRSYRIHRYDSIVLRNLLIATLPVPILSLWCNVKNELNKREHFCMQNRIIRVFHGED